MVSVMLMTALSPPNRRPVSVDPRSPAMNAVLMISRPRLEGSVHAQWRIPVDGAVAGVLSIVVATLMDVGEGYRLAHRTEAEAAAAISLLALPGPCRCQAAPCPRHVLQRSSGWNPHSD
jgi:hypothetical protein